MYKKIIIFIICIILVSSSISSINGVKIEKRIPDITFYNRNILYVGGEGPNNYSKIQNAIDAAFDGDTVFVYNGIYYEIITINTTINLKGEDKKTTIINGSEIGIVVTINANFVNITGFTFQKSNFYKYAIEVKSDYNNISNNIFIDNGYGIYSIGTNNNTIKENTFSNHRWTCIYVLESNENIITDNYFNNNDPGLGVSIGYSDSSIISNNYFSWTKYGISTGFCNNLVIVNNNLIGKSIETAIDLDYTNSSIISDNNIDSWTTGIQIDSSNYNLIIGNNIMNCDFYGYFGYGIYCDVESNYNNLSSNVLLNNINGIYMSNFCFGNRICGNNFTSNDYGIYIKYQTSCNNNTIFHNNFDDNNVNALDGCSNIWNIIYPNGGNFWDDYTGNDSNGDGIGDIALNLPGGGGNKDYFPLMYPWGQQRPVANYTYFEEYGGYVFNSSSSYDRDGEVVSFEWDFGDGTTDSEMVVSHAFNESGVYDITVIVTDNDGYKGILTKTIDVVKNYPPDTPTIDGPSSGKWGKPYYFTFQSSDNENSEIWYYIDWGDEHNSGWMGPFASGDEISEPHTWGSQDSYVVRCKVKDVYDFESDWSEFEIEIPRTRASSYPWIEWFLEYYPILGRLLNLLI